MIKLGIIQMSMKNSLENNLSKAFQYIHEAAKNGAQVILLPELFETLYFCQEKSKKNFALAHSFENHPFISKFQELALTLKVVLPVSFFERCDKSYYSSLAMINADGKCLGLYRKTHVPSSLYYEEKYYFDAGNTGFKVWNTFYGKIGVGICWDQVFPECTRTLNWLGAELLLFPSSFGYRIDENDSIDRSQMLQNVIVGHAIVNSVYIAVSNRVGREGSLDFFGNSFVTNFTGDKIAGSNSKSDFILYANCDLEAAKKFKNELGCAPYSIRASSYNKSS